MRRLKTICVFQKYSCFNDLLDYNVSRGISKIFLNHQFLEIS